MEMGPHIKTSISPEELARGYDSCLRAFIVKLERTYEVRLDESERLEVLSDVYAQLLNKALAAYRGRCSITTYLFYIVRSRFVDCLRRRSRRRELPLDEFLEIADWRSTTKDRREECGRAVTAIEAVVGTLPPLDREIYRLVCRIGKTQEQAAVAVGRSQSVVSDRVGRMRRVLREVLRREHPSLFREIFRDLGKTA